MHYARCNSHRARERLFAALGRKPDAYYSFRIGDHRGIYLIEETEIILARSVKGVTIIQKPERYNFMKCWTGDYPLRQ